MTRLHDSAVACLAIVAGFAAVSTAGCDGTPQQDTLPRKQPTVVDVDALPPLGPPIGPLDDGRIEVAPPEDWYVPPRSDRWLIRFIASEDAAYPGIYVTVEPYEGVFTVTAANWDVLADQIAATYETPGAAASQPMTFTPVEVGPLMGVSYRRRGKAAYGPKEIVVERFLLDTVVAGRRYTFELRTREDDLDRYQPYLFAVAAGVLFIEPAAGDAPPTTDGDKPADPIEASGNSEGDIESDLE